MATVDLATRLGAGYHPTISEAKKVYVIQREINLADAVTEKGSALAQSDVIQVIDVPAHSVILGVTVKVDTVMTGTSTDATIDVGVTGVDADAFVDGLDLDGASAGDYAAQPAAYQPIVIGGTADTIDILIATQTGTITGGVLLVSAILADVTEKAAPGLAAVGS